MRNAERILIVATIISGLGAMKHLAVSAKYELDLRPQHDLGLDTPDFVAIVHKVVLGNLLEGFWYFLITALLIVSIYLLKKAA